MAKLMIVIVDVKDKVEVHCEGDTRIFYDPTPAQILADRLMKEAAEELKCHS